MKILLIGIIALLFQSSMAGQTFEVDTLLFNGDPEKFINIVVLSDGYVADELDQFVDDAKDFSEYLFTEEPYKSYQRFFNVIAIKVPSNESGASHPGTATDVSEPAHPVEIVDNYFGSAFDAAGIHRLLVVNKYSTVFNVLGLNFPLYDQVVVLVNTPHYGGSGGQLAVSSLNSSANEIAVHEIGHSFANLIDEYYAGDQYSGEGINMSAETDPSKVKWKNWIGFNEVGIYQHCCSGESSEWYRPHENCKMRVLGPSFCPVCIEGTLERIHALVPFLNRMEPENTIIEADGSLLEFNIDLKKPEPNNLHVVWTLNDEIIAEEVDSIELSPEMLLDGSNEVLVTIEDLSPLIRIDNHSNIHTDFALWEISNSPSNAIEIAGNKEHIHLSFTPNPFEDRLIISLIETPDFNIEIDIFNVLGQLVYQTSIAGKSQETVRTSKWKSGTYVVQFRKGKRIIASRKVVKQ